MSSALEDRLRRLLGPAEAELSCDDCFDQLDRYVEREVSGADAPAEMPMLHAHLDGCAACREDHESLLDLVQAKG